MPAASIGDHVDKDILAEPPPILGSEFANPYNGFGIVAIDMEDGAAKCLRQVRCIVARTPRIGGSGKADLVVHHNVHGAAHGIAPQLRQVNGFGNNTQAGECGITVQ